MDDGFELRGVRPTRPFLHPIVRDSAMDNRGLRTCAFLSNSGGQREGGERSI